MNQKEGVEAQEQNIKDEQANAINQNNNYMMAKTEYYDIQKANNIEEEDVKRTIKESLNS
jgi:hypothetical protein